MSTGEQTLGRPLLMSCHECGLLHRVKPLPHGAKATCSRCRFVFYRNKRNGNDRTIALNISALIFFILANVYPFMTFKLEGREQVNTLISGVIEFYQRDLWFLAILVLGVTILVPLLKILASLYVLIPIKFNRKAKGAITVFRCVEILHPWSMIEVYLLGVLVAIVKLSDIATIDFGPALYCFSVLILLMVAADASLEPHDVWEKLQKSKPLPKSDSSQGQPAANRDATLLACHACGLVSRFSRRIAQGHPACPRCGAKLHHRKTNSINRTWALLITAFILYIPANVYPVMTVISFGKGEPDTILSGVVLLIEADMWPLALLVFFASITVPMLKLVGLTFLLISVQRSSAWRPKDRTVLYRIVESVGRWSMIDVFMISILIALVKLGSIATIEPGIGSTAFAAVVVTTMFAAMTFEPRMIWDRIEERAQRV